MGQRSFDEKVTKVAERKRKVRPNERVRQN